MPGSYCSHIASAASGANIERWCCSIGSLRSIANSANSADDPSSSNTLLTAMSMARLRSSTTHAGGAGTRSAEMSASTNSRGPVARAWYTFASSDVRCADAERRPGRASHSRSTFDCIASTARSTSGSTGSTGSTASSRSACWSSGGSGRRRRTVQGRSSVVHILTAHSAAARRRCGPPLPTIVARSTAA